MKNHRFSKAMAIITAVIAAAVPMAEQQLSANALPQLSVAAAAATKSSKTSESDKSRRTAGDITKIVINEICAKNKKSLKDSDGEASDWIELYNPTEYPVSLEGAGLSDDADEPLKWVFPNVKIQAKGYLVVFCSDKNRKTGELHTNFKLSAGNEQILLSDSNGKTIDSVIACLCDTDETVGRVADGGNKFAILSATPGESNSKSKFTRDMGVAAPVFSEKSGFYENAFNLKITAEPGTTIYYTTDGSVPTTSSKKFSSEIAVKDPSGNRAVLTYKTGTTANTSDERFPKKEFEKAAIIRAMAVDSNGKKSSVSTATYFIGSKIASKYKNATVISVVSDPSGLYDYNKGIFVAGSVFAEWRKKNPTAPLDGASQGNYNQRGKEWEREAHIDFFREGGLKFSENVGMRTHGGWSRSSQQKSMKFYFRSDYGSSKLKYQLFANNKAYDNNKTIKEYKRFMIRNGGNDAFSLLYKDAWTQSLVKNFPFATQDSDVAVCFLDGEYWGVYTMMEVYNDDYLEENYGVDAKNVVMVKAGALEEGNDKDFKLWEDTVSFIANNDMANTDNYKKACSLIDMNSLSEYIALNAYIGNEDWLWNNWAVWRVRETSDAKYHDGKWRLMCYDTEFSMDLYGNGKNYKYDVLANIVNGDGHLGPMLKSLLKNGEFKRNFVLALEDIMNIAFNPQSAAAQLDKFHSQYSPYIPQHFERFVFWQNLDGISKNRDSWKNWLKNRYNYMPQQINSALKLGTSATHCFTLSINDTKGGWVYVNGLPVRFTNGKWSGHYFAGYKITVKAVPAKGYEFSGWSNGYDSKNAEFKIDPTGAFSVTANFKKTN